MAALAGDYVRVSTLPDATGNAKNVEGAALTGIDTVTKVVRQIQAIGSPTVAAQVAEVSLQNALLVDAREQRATYAAAIAALNPGTSATTDIFTLYGSATKVVKVKKISIGGNEATGASEYNVTVERRSTAVAGGAATTITSAKYASAQAGATAVAKGWTTTPTAGTAAGVLGAKRLFCPLAGTPALGNEVSFEFDPPVTLSGVLEGLALTLNAATPAHAPALDVTCVFTEE